jgi:hypothetical protein
MPAGSPLTVTWTAPQKQVPLYSLIVASLDRITEQ